VSVVDRFTLTATIRTVSDDIADEYGDPTTSETLVDVPCHARQIKAEESADDVESERWRIYIRPDGPDLKTSDLVDVLGMSFEIDGPPAVHMNPRTRLVEARSFEMTAVA